MIGPARPSIPINTSSFVPTCWADAGALRGRVDQSWRRDARGHVVPAVTIADMVRLQKMLIDHLGIGGC
jgi:homoserine acetyltransferase